MKKIRVGIIGAGKMGEALIAGVRHSKHAKSYEITATTRDKVSSKAASRSLKIDVGTDNRKLVKNSDVIILCVKPQQAESVLRDVRSQMTKDKLLISVCASITNAQLKKFSGGKASVIRSMPNTPCLIGEGMTVFAPAENAKPEHIATAQELFGNVGRTAVVDEHLMDAVTGLSGCGPAYIFMIIESLSEAGVKAGLQRKTATLLAAQTMLGAAKMVLDLDQHPAALKDEVTTPAGCTIDGLMALEDGGLRSTIIKGVLAATKRSASLK